MRAAVARRTLPVLSSCFLALAVVVLPPAGRANAGTAGYVAGFFADLIYMAAPGETNDVSVSGSDRVYTIHDPAGVTAGPDCTQIDAATVSCTRATGYDHIKVHTKDGNDTITAQTDVQVTLDGGGGNDTLQGGTELDRLVGGPGADLMSGGANPGYDGDQADYRGRTDPVAVSLDGVANDGRPGEGDNVLPDVEDVWGGSGNDHLTGSAGRDILVGNVGNDTLHGLGGIDQLFGAAGNDTVEGGGGVDYLYASQGNDVLEGDGGNDSIFDSYGSDTLSGGAGDDDLSSGGDGIDSVACGVGWDSASVGSHDDAAPDCEDVTVF